MTAERPLRAYPADTDLLNRTFPVARRRPGQPPALTDALHVGEMRRLTRRCLDESGLSWVADDAVLAVSELVTNAVQHSHGHEITLTVATRGSHLDIRVHDGVPKRLPSVSKPDARKESGRGMWLVASIARQRHGTWGTSDNGATTWCALALDVR